MTIIFIGYVLESLDNLDRLCQNFNVLEHCLSLNQGRALWNGPLDPASSNGGGVFFFENV